WISTGPSWGSFPGANGSGVRWADAAATKGVEVRPGSVAGRCLESVLHAHDARHPAGDPDGLVAILRAVVVTGQVRHAVVHADLDVGVQLGLFEPRADRLLELVVRHPTIVGVVVVSVRDGQFAAHRAHARNRAGDAHRF